MNAAHKIMMQHLATFHLGVGKHALIARFPLESAINQIEGASYSG
jgi:hypothetical protein